MSRVTSDLNLASCYELYHRKSSVCAGEMLLGYFNSICSKNGCEVARDELYLGGRHLLAWGTYPLELCRRRGFRFSTHEDDDDDDDDQHAPSHLCRTKAGDMSQSLDPVVLIG
ncbi:hypothetical protein B296_00011314 [Ensete ventricosum]|uniref:Uncharacterized protein n=1 Tax=Ensete ventricosum TaxID=4639 RepID=A0A426ZNU6_ENSVE|nr:hypothetical protein B296_00011314 [Ensete ventricosum]